MMMELMARLVPMHIRYRHLVDLMQKILVIQTIGTKAGVLRARQNHRVRSARTMREHLMRSIVFGGVVSHVRGLQ